jgi:hypothetical protein
VSVLGFRPPLVRAWAQYPVAMSSFQDAEKPAKPSLAKRALAILVLVIVVALLAKVLIGFVMAVFWIVVAAAAVIAVLWAVNQLL